MYILFQFSHLSLWCHQLSSLTRWKPRGQQSSLFSYIHPSTSPIDSISKMYHNQFSPSPPTPNNGYLHTRITLKEPPNWPCCPSCSLKFILHTGAKRIFLRAHIWIPQTGFSEKYLTLFLSTPITHYHIILCSLMFFTTWNYFINFLFIFYLAPPISTKLDFLFFCSLFL